MTSRLLTIRIKISYAFGGSKPPPYEYKGRRPHRCFYLFIGRKNLKQGLSHLVRPKKSEKY